MISIHRGIMSKASLVTILRNKETDLVGFRAAAMQLAALLAAEVADQLPMRTIRVTTPVGVASGQCYQRDLILAPILRAGLAFLPAFLTLFPSAKIGMVGVRRDESTAIGFEYYHNVPHIAQEHDIILLDPMIATGGSATIAIRELLVRGAQEESIILASAIAAPEGLQQLNHLFPKLRIVCAQIDQCLNAQKYIVPGLGDFGDRFFGTE